MAFPITNSNNKHTCNRILKKEKFIIIVMTQFKIILLIKTSKNVTLLITQV